MTTRTPALRTLLTIAFIAVLSLLLAAGCSSRGNDGRGVEQAGAPLAPGIAVCPGIAVTTESIQMGCDRYLDQRQQVNAVRPELGTPPAIEIGKVYSVSLAPLDAPGQYGGAVTLTPSTSGEYVFYGQQRDLPLSIRRADGTGTAEICGKSLTDTWLSQVSGGGGFCAFDQAFVAFALEANVPYTIEFGPFPNPTTLLLGLVQRLPGTTLHDGLVSCPTGELPDPAICESAATTTPVTAGYLGTIAPPALSEGVAYGVHLRDYRGDREGSLTFTAPAAGRYTFFLGTPYIGLSVRPKGVGMRQAPTCGNLVRVDGCPLRGMQTFELNSGTEVRVDLTTPANDTVEWVRLLVRGEPFPANPIPLLGLSLWLKSDSGVTLDSDGRVTAWADTGPEARQAVPPSTSTRRPFYETGGPNGQPWIRFTGGQSLVLDPPLTLPAYTIFFVGESTTANVNASATVLGPTQGQTDNWIRYQAQQYLRLKLGSLAGGEILWADTRAAHLSTVMRTQTTIATYVNGAFRGSFGIANPSTEPPVELGELGSRYGANLMQGDLAEVIVYDRALTDAELSQVHAYLLGKYAL